MERTPRQQKAHEYYLTHRELSLARRKVQAEKEKALRALARAGDAAAEAALTKTRITDRRSSTKQNRKKGVVTWAEYLQNLPPRQSMQQRDAKRRLRIAQGVTAGDPQMMALHERIKAQTRERVRRYLIKKNALLTI